MLAGAHDAGAYRDYQGIGDDNWATSAVFAQEEDLLHQVRLGSPGRGVTGPAAAVGSALPRYPGRLLSLLR